MRSAVLSALFFATAAVLLASRALTHGGWSWLTIWPALSLALVASGYVTSNANVFGKRSDGTMNPVNVAVLCPYLFYSWTVWHLIRLASKDTPWNAVNERLIVGRRLLNREFPEGVSVVVDLASEFIEVRKSRLAGSYVSFPILDGTAPGAPGLVKLVRDLCLIEGRIYIHCAQGYGRTALVAALFLLALNAAKDPGDAVRMIQNARPRVRLNSMQRHRLDEAFAILRAIA